MKFKVAFANIYQGMHFAGEKDGEDVFFGYKPNLYAEYFTKLEADILCLAEVPFRDKDGNSDFLDKLQKNLGYSERKSFVSDDSWLVDGLFYGSSILSRFNFEKYQETKLLNPKLEAINNGVKWVMHDKTVQNALIQINGSLINLHNLHYFPFHHFGASLLDEKFTEIRRGFTELFKNDQTENLLIAGDFNNKGIEIEKAFPELFQEFELEEAIKFNRNDVEKYYEGDDIQVDHLLYTPAAFELVNSSVHDNYSDHPTLVAEFEV